MAKKTPAPAAKKAQTPADSGPPDEHFDEAETLPAAPAQPTPKKATRRAKANPRADELAEKVGNPEGVDFNADNVTKIGSAHNARGKKQAVEEGEGDEAEDNE